MCIHLISWNFFEVGARRLSKMYWCRLILGKPFRLVSGLRMKKNLYKQIGIVEGILQDWYASVHILKFARIYKVNRSKFSAKKILSLSVRSGAPFTQISFFLMLGGSFLNLQYYTDTVLSFFGNKARTSDFLVGGKAPSLRAISN